MYDLFFLLQLICAPNKGHTCMKPQSSFAWKV